MAATYQLAGPEEFADFANEIRFALRALPSAESLAKDPALFEDSGAWRTTSDSEFEFVDVGRRFHALFRGIWADECVGGHCEMLDRIAPSRYLIPLLENGHEIHVLESGRYAGYISNTEVQFAREKYLSLEVLSPAMSKFVMVTNKSQTTARSLLDVWLKDERRRIHPSIRGWLVGQSGSVNNMGGLSAIRRSEAWMAGTEGPKAETILPTDSLWTTMVDLTKQIIEDEQYQNGRLIFDLGVTGAKTTLLLRPATAFINLGSMSGCKTSLWVSRLKKLSFGPRSANSI